MSQVSLKWLKMNPIHQSDISQVDICSTNSSQYLLTPWTISALVGRTISDTHRKIFALPIRLRGIGIRYPTVTSNNEFKESTRITETLTDITFRQERKLDNYDKDRVAAIIKDVKKERDQHHQNILTEISNSADEKLKNSERRTLELLQEKGAGA